MYILTHVQFHRELDNPDFSEEKAQESFINLSFNGDGKLSLPEMEAMLRRKTIEALEEDEINSVHIHLTVWLDVEISLSSGTEIAGRDQGWTESVWPGQTVQDHDWGREARGQENGEGVKGFGHFSKG